MSVVTPRDVAAAVRKLLVPFDDNFVYPQLRHRRRDALETAAGEFVSTHLPMCALGGIWSVHY